jgi:hypothetical protein
MVGTLTELSDWAPVLTLVLLLALRRRSWFCAGLVPVCRAEIFAIFGWGVWISSVVLIQANATGSGFRCRSGADIGFKGLYALVPAAADELIISKPPERTKRLEASPPSRGTAPADDP